MAGFREDRLPELRDSALRTDDGWRSEGTGVMGGRREFPQYATYDEHGRWMANLFLRDPKARIKSAVHDFDGIDSFHIQTDTRRGARS